MRNKYLWLAIVLMVICGIAAVRDDTTIIGDVNLTNVLPFDELEQIGLTTAQGIGIVGEPTHTQKVLMSMSDYSAFTGTGLAAAGDNSPVYVYVATGTINGLPRIYGAGNFGPDTVFNGVEVLIDATTGLVLEVAARPEWAESVDYTHPSRIYPTLGVIPTPVPIGGD